MNDRQLEAFVAIADAQSINRAARELSVSQQSLTYQLQSLEDELGYPLFERTRKGVRLTARGEEFRRDAEQILALMRGALERGREAQRAETIRVSPRSDAGTMILAATCDAFAREHPEVDVRYVPLPVSQQLRGLRTGMFDVTETPDRDAVHEQGLCFEGIVDSPQCCLVRRQDPLAKRDLITLDDLHGRRVALISQGSCRGADRLRALIRARHPQIWLGDMEYNASQITIGSLEDWVIITPRAFANHNINPNAQILVALDTDIRVSVGLVYAGERPLPVVRKFIEVARRLAGEGAFE